MMLRLYASVQCHLYSTVCCQHCRVLGTRTLLNKCPRKLEAELVAAVSSICVTSSGFMCANYDSFCSVSHPLYIAIPTRGMHGLLLDFSWTAIDLWET